MGYSAWYKRFAVAALVAVGGAVMSIPVSGMLLFGQYNRETQAGTGDGESGLHALAMAVGIALLVAGLCFVGTMVVFVAGSVFGIDFGLNKRGKKGTITDPQLLEGTDKG